MTSLPMTHHPLPDGREKQIAPFQMSDLSDLVALHFVEVEAKRFPRMLHLRLDLKSPLPSRGGCL